jgi:hypothetical protein
MCVCVGGGGGAPPRPAGEEGVRACVRALSIILARNELATESKCIIVSKKQEEGAGPHVARSPTSWW